MERALRTGLREVCENPRFLRVLDHQAVELRDFEVHFAKPGLLGDSLGSDHREICVVAGNTPGGDRTALGKILGGNESTGANAADTFGREE